MVYLCVFYFFAFFLGLHPPHMEVTRLVGQTKLQLPAYTTATAMPDPSYVCDLHHSSQQCQILYSLSETRNQICILVDAGQIRFPSHDGNAVYLYILKINTYKIIKGHFLSSVEFLIHLGSENFQTGLVIATWVEGDMKTQMDLAPHQALPRVQ